MLDLVPSDEKNAQHCSIKTISFIVKRPGPSGILNLLQASQRVAAELDTCLNVKTCQRPTKMMSSLLTVDQSAKAPSVQGVSLQTLSLIDISRTSRSSAHI